IVAGAIATLLNPLGLAVALAVALGAAFYYLGDSNTELGEKLRELAGAFKPVWEAIKAVGQALWEDLVAIWEDYLKEDFERLWTTLAEELLPALERFVPVAGEILGAVVNVLGPALSMVIQIAKDMLSHFSGFLDFMTGIFTGDMGLVFTGL